MWLAVQQTGKLGFLQKSGTLEEGFFIQFLKLLGVGGREQFQARRKALGPNDCAREKKSKDLSRVRVQALQEQWIKHSQNSIIKLTVLIESKSAVNYAGD